MTFPEFNKLTAKNEIATLIKNTDFGDKLKYLNKEVISNK